MPAERQVPTSNSDKSEKLREFSHIDKEEENTKINLEKRRRKK